VFTWFRRKLEIRKAKKAAALAILDYFHSINEDTPARCKAKVLHFSDSDAVVRVRFGERLPPERRWFRICHPTQEIEEITFDEARQFGEVPWPK